MNKTKILCLIVITLMSVGASAQLTVDESKHHSDLNLVENCGDFSLGYLMVNGTHKISGGESKDIGLNGFLFSTEGFLNISKQKSLPLFLILGGDIGAAFGDYSISKDFSVSSVALNLHAGITYKFRVAKDIVIAPSLCFGIKWNALAIAKGDDYNIGFLTTKKREYDIPYSSEESANHFQPEIMFGLKVCYKKIFIGYRYYLDVIPFYDYDNSKISLGYHALTLGLTLKSR